MAARLKVFGWSDGFHSWSVATSSRPKALEAWNIDQDIFKTGLAREIESGPEREAALASPGTVIKTGAAIDPGVIEALKSKPSDGVARRKKAKARAAKIRDQIEALETEIRGKIDALSAEQDALQDRIDRVQADHDKAAAKLTKALRDASD